MRVFEGMISLCLRKGFKNNNNKPQLRSFALIYLPPPSPTPFHYSMTTLRLAKSSILNILLLYLPDFLFCPCKWEFLWFATSLDNVTRPQFCCIKRTTPLQAEQSPNTSLSGKHYYLSCFQLIIRTSWSHYCKWAPNYKVAHGMAAFPGEKNNMVKVFQSMATFLFSETFKKSFHIAVEILFKTSVKGTFLCSLKLALKQQLMGMLNIKNLLWGTDLHSKQTI